MKNRICKMCKLEYTPTGTRQKFCGKSKVSGCSRLAFAIQAKKKYSRYMSNPVTKGKRLLYFSKYYTESVKTDPRKVKIRRKRAKLYWRLHRIPDMR